MRKYFKLLVLATMAVCMATGSALAGTTYVNHGAAATNITVARETLGSARNVTVNNLALGVGTLTTTPALSFALGAELSTANLLYVEFAGGASMMGVAVKACALNGGAIGTQVGSVMPVAGNTKQPISFTSTAGLNVAVGNVIWLTTTDSCAGTATNAAFGIKIATDATTPTVKIYQTAQSAVIDDSTPVTVATLVQQYSVANSSTTHTIDYLEDGATGNKIINTGTAGNSTADSQAATANVNIVAFASNATLGYDAADANVTVAGQIKVTDPDQSWAGVNRVWVAASGTLCAAGNVVSQSAPTGTVTLNIPASTGTANWPGATKDANQGYNLCIGLDGTTLSTRTIKAQGLVNMTGTGAGTGVTGSVSNAQVWGINGYQAIIPFQQLSAGRETYCLINNGNTTVGNANVLFSAISSENGSVVATTSLGTVAEKTSKLLTLDATSATLAGGTAVPLAATLGADKRYSAKMTVTASPANVTVACIQVDANGSKRLVPVLTSETTGTYKQ